MRWNFKRSIECCRVRCIGKLEIPAAAAFDIESVDSGPVVGGRVVVFQPHAGNLASDIKLHARLATLVLARTVEGVFSSIVLSVSVPIDHK